MKRKTEIFLVTFPHHLPFYFFTYIQDIKKKKKIPLTVQWKKEKKKNDRKRKTEEFFCLSGTSKEDINYSER